MNNSFKIGDKLLEKMVIFSIGLIYSISSFSCSDSPISTIADQPLKVLLRVKDSQLENQLYIVNADGTDVTKLTSGESSKSHAVWSPDGSKIAFTNDRGGSFTRFFHDIHVINPDGTGEINLTDTYNIHESQPSWSPDGHKIAYLSGTFVDSVDSKTGIYIMDSDGANKINLTPNLNVKGTPYPVWSPDNTKIAFAVTLAEHDNGIWVMNTDGTTQRNLTPDTGSYFDHIWSPDGSKIAFASTKNGTAEIFIIGIDGSNIMQLTSQEEQDARQPSWSPDGTKIAYRASTRQGPLNYVVNIFVIDIYTKEKNRLTDSAENFSPSWSPDGTQITYYSNENQDLRVHIMNTDGSGVTPLTDLRETGQRRISWSPTRR